MTAHPTFSLARWSRQTNAMGTLRFFAMWVDTFWGRSLRSSWNDKVPSMSVPTLPSLEESGPFWNYKDTVQIKNQFHVLSTQQKCMKTTACLFIKSIFKLFAVQFFPPKLLVVSLASVGISLDPAASVSSIDSLAGPFSPAFLDLVVSRCQITPFSFLTSSFFAVFA